MPDFTVNLVQYLNAHSAVQQYLSDNGNDASSELQALHAARTTAAQALNDELDARIDARIAAF